MGISAFCFSPCAVPIAHEHSTYVTQKLVNTISLKPLKTLLSNFTDGCGHIKSGIYQLLVDIGCTMARGRGFETNFFNILWTRYLEIRYTKHFQNIKDDLLLQYIGLIRFWLISDRRNRVGMGSYRNVRTIVTQKLVNTISLTPLKTLLSNFTDRCGLAKSGFYQLLVDIGCTVARGRGFETNFFNILWTRYLEIRYTKHFQNIRDDLLLQYIESIRFWLISDRRKRVGMGLYQNVIIVLWTRLLKHRFFASF